MHPISPCLVFALILGAPPNVDYDESAGQETVVYVPAAQAWTDTGLYFDPGQVVHITADGYAGVSEGDHPGHPPDGSRDCVAQADWVAPGLPCWSLVGRFDNGPPQAIGHEAYLRGDGHLYLGMNDERARLSDNERGWTAVVSGTDDGETSTAAQQAHAVDAVLSGHTRLELTAALEEIQNCRDVSSAVTTVRQVAESRRRQLEQLTAVQVDTVPDGSGLKGRLDDALRASLNADESFLVWATRAASECTSNSTADPDYVRGMDYSRAATAAKERFVSVWNPIARRYGLPERSPDDI
ncbi:hypothetical protein [Microbispora rosea]|uniref:hypothetical protein n=1 Tax=Microbispora rosea TaxID=58117 RepID=UPI00341D452A